MVNSSGHKYLSTLLSSTLFSSCSVFSISSPSTSTLRDNVEFPLSFFVARYSDGDGVGLRNLHNGSI